jgi:hypothetical protein
MRMRSNALCSHSNPYPERNLRHRTIPAVWPSGVKRKASRFAHMTISQGVNSEHANDRIENSGIQEIQSPIPSSRVWSLVPRVFSSKAYHETMPLFPHSSFLLSGNLRRRTVPHDVASLDLASLPSRCTLTISQGEF